MGPHLEFKQCVAIYPANKFCDFYSKQRKKKSKFPDNYVNKIVLFLFQLIHTNVHSCNALQFLFFKLKPFYLFNSCINPPTTTRVKICQNVDILAKVHVYLVHLTLLWLQGSKSVKMLIYTCQGISSALNPPVTARVKISQNVDHVLAKVYLCTYILANVDIYTCQGISSALNPPVTARVKISQNVDILAKVHVYLVHLTLLLLHVQGSKSVKMLIYKQYMYLPRYMYI